MGYNAAPLEKLIEEFSKFPGIGRKGATRMAYQVLSMSDQDAAALAGAIQNAHTKLHRCRVCQNYTEAELCPICASAKRDRSVHHSTPDLEQMDGEEFPVTLGKQVKKTRQALQALGTAYYHISRLNLKTKKIELVKRSRKRDLDIKDNSADWDPQFKIIEDIIAEPPWSAGT